MTFADDILKTCGTFLEDVAKIVWEYKWYIVVGSIVLIFWLFITNIGGSVWM